MTTTKLHKLAELGQSVWLDYMHRSLVNSSGLRTYVEQGLRGITSNPAIFEKAISQSNLYDGQIHELGVEGKSAQEIYEELTFEDARRAADDPSELVQVPDDACRHWRAARATGRLAIATGRFHQVRPRVPSRCGRAETVSAR